MPQGVTRIVPLTLDCLTPDLTFLGKNSNCISQLDLAAVTRGEALQDTEYLGLEDIPAHNRHVRRRLVRYRLLDEERCPPEPVRLTLPQFGNAVPLDLITGNRPQGDDVASFLRGQRGQLAYGWFLTEEYLIGKQYCEGTSLHVALGHQDGVPKPQRLALADEVDRCPLRQPIPNVGVRAPPVSLQDS